MNKWLYQWNSDALRKTTFQGNKSHWAFESIQNDVCSYRIRMKVKFRCSYGISSSFEPFHLEKKVEFKF